MSPSRATSACEIRYDLAHFTFCCSLPLQKTLPNIVAIREAHRNDRSGNDNQQRHSNSNFCSINILHFNSNLRPYFSSGRNSRPAVCLQQAACGKRVRSNGSKAVAIDQQIFSPPNLHPNTSEAKRADKDRRTATTF